MSGGGGKLAQTTLRRFALATFPKCELATRWRFRPYLTPTRKILWNQSITSLSLCCNCKRNFNGYAYNFDHADRCVHCRHGSTSATSRTPMLATKPEVEITSWCKNNPTQGSDPFVHLCLACFIPSMYCVHILLFWIEQNNSVIILVFPYCKFPFRVRMCDQLTPWSSLRPS